LEKVEAHLNEGSSVSSWLGIRVYEPERLENGEVVWHLRINPNPKLKKILTIGVYEGHAFLIKDIAKLVKTYACTHCGQRFTTVQSQTASRNLQRGKNGNLLPGDKSGSPTDSFRESDVPKRLSIETSDSVAGVGSEATGHPHPPRDVWARGREMASARRRENEVFSC